MDTEGIAASLQEIVISLNAITERLDDLSFEALRSAVSSGEQKRPEIDKRLIRARNQISRAIRLLENGETNGDWIFFVIVKDVLLVYLGHVWNSLQIEATIVSSGNLAFRSTRYFNGRLTTDS